MGATKPSMNDSFNPYQADVLFLLIGSNPLPNFVAATLMARSRATVVLLHTGATAAVAERLARRLRDDRPGLTLQLHSVAEADGPAIARKVGAVTQSLGQTSPKYVVALNYTGGTKPMATYSYRVLFQLFPEGIFSYLDARSLSMVIDQASRTVQHVPVGDSVQLTLDDIAGLHGYEIRRSRQQRSTLLANAIMETHLATDGMRQWRTWLESWRENIRLPTPNEFPSIAPVLQAFSEVCEGTVTDSSVARVVGFNELKQCGKYFGGEWLEDYTLEALVSIADDAHLNDFAAGAVIQAPGRPDFEFDVIATLSYQLFGISCVVTEQKARAKEHLMEVFTRAKQLGGDEARFAAVTLCDDRQVRDLENDVTQTWDAVGKIKIFGRPHLRNLSAHLLTWFREANQEVS